MYLMKRMCDTRILLHHFLGAYAVFLFLINYLPGFQIELYVALAFVLQFQEVDPDEHT